MTRSEIVEMSVPTSEIKKFRKLLDERRDKIRQELKMTDEDWDDATHAAFAGFAGMSEGGAFTCNADFLEDASPNFLSIFCDVLGTNKQELQKGVGDKGMKAIIAAMLKAFEVGATIMAIRANYRYDGPLGEEVKSTKEDDNVRVKF